MVTVVVIKSNKTEISVSSVSVQCRFSVSSVSGEINGRNSPDLNISQMRQGGRFYQVKRSQDNPRVHVCSQREGVSGGSDNPPPSQSKPIPLGKLHLSITIKGNITIKNVMITILDIRI